MTDKYYYWKCEKMSSAISFLRFPLTVFIVMYHCYCVQTPINQPIYAAMTYPFGLIIGETGVPAFFFISGFLFFYSQRTYSQKLRTRITTLLIPYIFWNSLILFVYVILMLIGHPQEIAGKSISNFQLQDYIRAFIDRGNWDRGNGQPMLCPYWYVRNLLILSLLSPFIKLTMKKGIGILCLFVLAFWWISLPYNGMIAQSLLFFCMGSYFSINKIDILSLMSGKATKILTFAWFLFLFLDWSTHFIFYIKEGLYIHRLVLIFNIFIILYYGWNLSQSHHWPTLLDRSSFWIYTTHFPLTIIVRFCRPNISDIAQITLYWSSIAFVIMTCIIIYYLANKLAPRIVAITMGNR